MSERPVEPTSRENRRFSGSDIKAGVFQKQGEYWTLVYGATLTRLRDAKGMACLAQLLSHPGEQFAARVLLSATARRDDEATVTAEQARLVVTKRIKLAIKRIQPHHPSLAHHLGTCVKTGHFCVYVPDPTQPVSWVMR
jgi:hypothetical protein